MPWVRKKLHDARVWAACDPQGKLLTEADQRVPVLYKKGGKVYRAFERNLQPDDEPEVISDAEAQPGGATPTGPATGPAATSATAAPATASAASPVPRPAARAASSPLALSLGPPGSHGAHLDSSLHVYTDGACTGNPGPMGIGVVVLDPSAPASGDGEPQRRELSEYLGVGTNNIAELTAILRGLQGLPRHRPVVVYSDSAYAIGLLSQNWKAKANQELVAELRRLLREFAQVRFVKVAGHAGVPENERCDELARTAITRRGAAASR